MFDPDTINGEIPEPPRKLWFSITVPFDAFWSFLRRFFSARAFLFCLVLGLPGSALARTEIPGDGIDNDSSGGDQAFSDCDADGDGYLAVGSSCTGNYFNVGSGQVNGTQSGVSTVTIDAGHTLGPGQIINIGGSTRRIYAITTTSIILEGATVNVTDNDSLTIVAQYDCTDSNRQVFPYSGPTTVGATGGNYHSCLYTGSYDSETAISSFAGSGGGSTWFVDDAETDCSGAGTYGDPEDYRCLFNTGMSGYHAPGAGDTIVFMCGDYTAVWGSSPSKMAFLNNIDGTRTAHVTLMPLPGCAWYEAGIGSGAVIKGGGTVSSDNVYPLHFTSTDYVDVFGLEIKTNTTGYNSLGIHWDGGGTGAAAIGNYIHDIQGECGSLNCSGVMLREGQNQGHVIGNRIKDVYETGDETNANTSAIGVMDSQQFNIRNNVTYTTVTNFAGYGVKLKHSYPSGQGHFVEGNIIYDHYHPAVKIGGYPNTKVRRNIISDVGGAAGGREVGGAILIDVGDGASANDFTNIDISYNTVRNSPAFSIGSYLTCAELGTAFFDLNHNIFEDNWTTAYNVFGSAGVIGISYYGSDTLRACMLDGSAVINYNCYYNTDGETLYFQEFRDDPAGGNGEGYSGLAAWQAASFSPDANSFSEAYSFDSSWRATSSNCSDKGARLTSEASGTTTTTTTTTTSSTTTSLVAANIGGLAPRYQ